jgi:hypothetical protein
MFRKWPGTLQNKLDRFSIFFTIKDAAAKVSRIKPERQ